MAKFLPVCVVALFFLLLAQFVLPDLLSQCLPNKTGLLLFLLGEVANAFWAIIRPHVTERVLLLLLLKLHEFHPR